MNIYEHINQIVYFGKKPSRAPKGSWPPHGGGAWQIPQMWYDVTNIRDEGNIQLIKCRLVTMFFNILACVTGANQATNQLPWRIAEYNEGLCNRLMVLYSITNGGNYETSVCKLRAWNNNQEQSSYIPVLLSRDIQLHLWTCGHTAYNIKNYIKVGYN